MSLFKASPNALALGEVARHFSVVTEGFYFPTARVFRNDRRGVHCTPVKPTFPIKPIYLSENERSLSAGEQCSPLQKNKKFKIH